ncbi:MULTISPECIES: hypothetical protein [unclassified Rhizobium]|uniref:hypothetical protein n=1 Tax=unclassified Rhizobium TaxID=2613769 RepID=UPI001445E8C1|nr:MULTISPECIES: hypothetical protein [unclassified Rhizobium]NKJ07962.1 hypothetical protein [Rhizobium sp. SG741]NKJ36794.1 hypothetical protein [Rhizobium sp. SG570]
MPNDDDPYVLDYFAFARAKDDTPVRWVASGRRTHPVGLVPLNKSKHFGVPWESRNVERNALRMLSACSRVVRINSQPHSLFFKVRGIRWQFRYTPDIEAHVERSFLDDLTIGRPLFEAVADPFHGPIAPNDAVPIVLEMKSTNDKSLQEPSNKTKMNLVKAIYAHVGQPFFILSERPHINLEQMHIITHLEAGARDAVGDLERSRCLFAFGRERCLTYGTLSHELGGQPKGERLVKALHFKQFVSIDLRNGLVPDALVWLRQQTEIARDV